MNDTSDDAELWERWKAEHDADAFAEIVSRHAPMVHSVSLRVLRSAADAEEVAQECFLELLRTRPTVGSSLGGLLHTLALRRSLDRLKSDTRRQARERYASDHRRAERIGEHDREAERVELEELLERVDEAIDELPEAMRDPIVLRFLEGKPSGAAAALLGIPESTLRLRLEKGIARVRSALKRRGLHATGSAVLAALSHGALEAAPRTLVAALGKIAVSGGAWVGGSPVGAGQEASSTGYTVVLGAVLMKKIALAFAALLFLVVCALGYRALDPDAQSPSVVLPQPVGSLPLTRDDPTEPARDASPTLPVDLGAPGSSFPRDDPVEPGIDVLCVDAQGETIAGAEVFLVERNLRPAKNAASVSRGPRTTGDDGLARFDAVPSPGGVWRVEVYARVRGRMAGIAARAVEAPRDAEAQAETEADADGPTDGNTMDEAGSEPLMVVLVASTRLRGRVEVPDGYDPTQVLVRISGIHLRDTDSPFGESLEPTAGEPLARALETRPGEDGAFAFDDVPTESRVSLEADALGLSHAATTAELDQARDQERDPVKLHLTPEGALEGTILFVDTRMPAEGVQLEARPIEDDGSFRAVTGANGAFRIAGLPEGRYSLGLAAPLDSDDWTLRVAGPFPISAGGTRSEIELLLERGAVVSGFVRNASTGAAAPGICIAAVSPAETGKRQLGAAVATVSGSYSIRLPAGDASLYIATQVPEYVYPVDQGLRTVTLAPGERMSGVDFALEPRFVPEPPIVFARVRGRVVDPAGVPLAQVSVHTFTLHDPTKPILGLYNRTVTTDDQGRFEASVPAGPQVYVEAGGHFHCTAVAEPFTVVKNEERIIADLVVRPATGTITGLVIGMGGEPIEGARVRASSKSKRHEGEPVRTGATGRFRIERLLEDEPAEVTVEKAGYTTFRAEGISSGSEALRFVLEPEPEGTHEGER